LVSVDIVCDFDGTIALEDVTDGLLDRFADARWRQIEAQWLSGEFGSRECMARQVELIEATREELDGYLDAVKIDPLFASFVNECDRLGNVSLEVSSDGIDYAVRRILDKHGLCGLRVRANALVALSATKYRLEFPHYVPNCRTQAGNCKCAAARKVSERPPSNSQTILIGDGVSDFCVASKVDFVFAKSRLLAHCRDADIPHRAFASFREIRRDLRQVLEAFEERPGFARVFKETASDR
jgi:2-hydroxy-3-keto-5-methylthiopentenyl-1-phosphate phosphatase